MYKQLACTNNMHVQTTLHNAYVYYTNMYCNERLWLKLRPRLWALTLHLDWLAQSLYSTSVFVSACNLHLTAWVH